MSESETLMQVKLLETELTQSIARTPRNAELFLRRAAIRLWLNSPESALEDALSAREYEESKPEVRKLLAVIIGTTKVTR